jgi:hypothetical protein
MGNWGYVKYWVNPTTYCVKECFVRYSSKYKGTVWTGGNIPLPKEWVGKRVRVLVELINDE